MPKPVRKAKTCLAILEVMWDWRSMTSTVGYKEEAPRIYRINPENFTGKRLYNWLENQYVLFVTNACKELVRSASEKGTPDPKWLSSNIKTAQPVDLILVCGKVAQSTFDMRDKGESRVVMCPHPAARTWNKESLHRMRRVIHTGNKDMLCTLVKPEKHSSNKRILKCQRIGNK